MYNSKSCKMYVIDDNNDERILFVGNKQHTYMKANICYNLKIVLFDTYSKKRLTL